MTLASIPRNAFRVRVVKQECSRDLGPHCVQLISLIVGFGAMHVARHTSKASAELHAKALRAALRGET